VEIAPEKRHYLVRARLRCGSIQSRIPSHLQVSSARIVDIGELDPLKITDFALAMVNSDPLMFAQFEYSVGFGAKPQNFFLIINACIRDF
jgi:hypothetical protein